MKDLTFITGNQNKADFLAKNLGIPLPHRKVDLDELQSLDLHEIAEHKARQAYDIVGKPALVEDVSLRLHGLGGLPGPFVKWFMQELGLERMCELLPPGVDRTATVTVCYCLFDGRTTRFFEGSRAGTIAPEPRGSSGFGFEAIFIPDGHQQTRAEMSEADNVASSHRTIALNKLRAFLDSYAK